MIRLVMTMMLPIWYALGRLLSDNGNPDLLQQYRFRQYRFNICPPYCCFSACVFISLCLSTSESFNSSPPVPLSENVRASPPLPVTIVACTPVSGVGTAPPVRRSTRCTSACSTRKAWRPSSPWASPSRWRCPCSAAAASAQTAATGSVSHGAGGVSHGVSVGAVAGKGM